MGKVFTESPLKPESSLYPWIREAGGPLKSWLPIGLVLVVHHRGVANLTLLWFYKSRHLFGGGVKHSLIFICNRNPRKKHIQPPYIILIKQSPVLHLVNESRRKGHTTSLHSTSTISACSWGRLVHPESKTGNLAIRAWTWLEVVTISFSILLAGVTPLASIKDSLEIKPTCTIFLLRFWSW